MMKSRMQSRLRLPALALSLGVALLGVLGCAQEEQPRFPIYAPTKPYLAEQARIQKRARALRAFRGSERVRNVVRFRSQTLAAWQPIYARVAAAEEERRRARKP
jgi:hypothetical protein